MSSEHAVLLADLLPDAVEVANYDEYTVFQIPTMLLYGMLVSYYVLNEETGAIEHLSQALQDARATAMALSTFGDQKQAVAQAPSGTVIQ